MFPRPNRFAPGVALLTVVFFATTAGLAFAQSFPEGLPQQIRVVAKPVVPFVMEEDGNLKGFSIDLWNRVAEEVGLDFETQIVTSMPDLISTVSSGKADVGVGAISITDERERVLDFSHPFFESGLQVMVKSNGTTNPGLKAFRALVSGPVFKAIVVILGAVFLVSNILWWFERRVNSDGFPHHYFKGLWESAWWSISVLISGGCENKAPVGIPGRLVAVVWMLAGIALTSFITASLASSMVSSNLSSGINSLADLGKAKVGSIKGSSALLFLQKKTKGLELVEFSNMDEAIDALGQSRIRALVYDGPIMQYFASKNPTAKLEVVGPMFELQDYGFALHLDSPYRKKINEAILKLKKTGYLDELERKWLVNVGV